MHEKVKALEERSAPAQDDAAAADSAAAAAAAGLIGGLGQFGDTLMITNGGMYGAPAYGAPLGGGIPDPYAQQPVYGAQYGAAPNAYGGYGAQGYY